MTTAPTAAAAMVGSCGSRPGSGRSGIGKGKRPATQSSAGEGGDGDGSAKMPGELEKSYYVEHWDNGSVFDGLKSTSSAIVV